MPSFDSSFDSAFACRCRRHRCGGLRRCLGNARLRQPEQGADRFQRLALVPLRIGDAQGLADLHASPEPADPRADHARRHRQVEIGRTQEIVYNLHSLIREGAIPSIPIYIDSPLAIDTTTVFEMHPELFDQSEDMVKMVKDLFEFPLVHYTRDVEESKALARRHGPMIIIAASGMVEAGRILHHLAQGASDPKNTILIVGFQAEHTLGRRIVEKAPVLRIFGEDVPLRARVEVINGYSAHADRTELAAWIDAVKTTSPNLKGVHLVHGEPHAQDALKTTLLAKGFSVTCPDPHTRVSF